MNNLTDSISRTDRLVIAALLLLSLGLYFYGLGNNAVWTQNEGYYTDAVRTMLETGDWMDIRYNGEPRYQKPPLVYWLMALSAALFGLKEWALRLPIVLGSLGAVWLTYVLTALLSHRKTGLLAAFVMFFSFQFAINARYATPDAPLTFFSLPPCTGGSAACGNGTEFGSGPVTWAWVLPCS